MTPFELIYLSLEPLLPSLYRTFRSRLCAIARTNDSPRILDCGGRKSHYTMGVPGRIIISDLVRETAIQNRLNLGVTKGVIQITARRRSNIAGYVIDDTTRSSFQSNSFNIITAVEVLEHIEDDYSFIKEVYRLLEPNGWFLMTTPNGDYIRNTNPDHKRHYTREQLCSLLERTFRSVTIDYAVRSGLFHKWGLGAWSPRQPVKTLKSVVGNFANYIESSEPMIRSQPIGTCHLIALAQK